MLAAEPAVNCAATMNELDHVLSIIESSEFPNILVQVTGVFVGVEVGVLVGAVCVQVGVPVGELGVEVYVGVEVKVCVAGRTC
jgi:uncharacterized transporter YbjL